MQIRHRVWGARDVRSKLTASKRCSSRSSRLHVHPTTQKPALDCCVGKFESCNFYFIRCYRNLSFFERCSIYLQFLWILLKIGSIYYGKRLIKTCVFVFFSTLRCFPPRLISCRTRFCRRLAQHETHRFAWFCPSNPYRSCNHWTSLPWGPCIHRPNNHTSRNSLRIFPSFRPQWTIAWCAKSSRKGGSTKSSTSNPWTPLLIDMALRYTWWIKNTQGVASFGMLQVHQRVAKHDGPYRWVDKISQPICTEETISSKYSRVDEVALRLCVQTKLQPVEMWKIHA